jgi:hypothetical protein
MKTGLQMVSGFRYKPGDFSANREQKNLWPYPGGDMLLSISGPLEPA